MGRVSAVALAGLLLISLVALGTIGGITAAESTDDNLDTELVHECADEPPDDFADPEDGNETIGWFDGYWYNEPLDINASNGISEDELANLSARTAARFEAMRCLTFEYLPPVEIINRTEFANETEADFEGVGSEERLYDNAKFETLLTIGSDEDSIDIRQADREVTVGGYYNFVEERIVVISDDPDQLMIDEEILAHELGHALQDQHFNLEEYERPTRDIDNAKLGVIEGDVHLIEQEYLEHCAEDRWNEPCVTDDSDPGEAGGDPPNWGLYFMQFQPYSDGPAFIEHIYESNDSWDAVDSLYDAMPNSSQQVIYPEKYNEVQPKNLTVNSTASEDWERIPASPTKEHNVIGQAGMASIFMDPTYDDPLDPSGPILDQDEFLNINMTTGEVDPHNPVNYDVWPVDGWAGDELYVYADEDNRTGSVWKTAWTDELQAAEFLEAYEALIEYRGGDQAENYEYAWEFGDESEFDQSVAVYPDENRVWIVTAPTTDELTDLSEKIQLIESSDDFEFPDIDTDYDHIRIDDADDGDINGDIDDEDDPMPGLGPVLAVAVVLLVGAWFRQKRIFR